MDDSYSLNQTQKYQQYNFIAKWQTHKESIMAQSIYTYTLTPATEEENMLQQLKH